MAATIPIMPRVIKTSAKVNAFFKISPLNTILTYLIVIVNTFNNQK